jgi:hypothetical protein
MTVFNRRNALVGFLTLKWLQQKRRRRRSGAKRIALFVSLGLVSAGILAAIAGILYRRHGSEEGQSIEGYAVGDDSEEEIVGEYVTAGPEPLPAT